MFRWCHFYQGADKRQHLEIWVNDAQQIYQDFWSFGNTFEDQCWVIMFTPPQNVLLKLLSYFIDEGNMSTNALTLQKINIDIQPLFRDPFQAEQQKPKPRQTAANCKAAKQISFSANGQ